MLPGFNVKVKLLLSSIWVCIYFELMQKVQKKISDGKIFCFIKCLYLAANSEWSCIRAFDFYVPTWNQNLTLFTFMKGIVHPKMKISW